MKLEGKIWRGNAYTTHVHQTGKFDYVLDDLFMELYFCIKFINYLHFSFFSCSYHCVTFFSRLTSSSECTHIGHYYALKSCFRNIETDHEASIRSFMDVVFSFFPFYTSFSISTSPNTEFHLYRFICMYSYVCQCWTKIATSKFVLDMQRRVDIMGWEEHLPPDI